MALAMRGSIEGDYTRYAMDRSIGRIGRGGGKIGGALEPAHIKEIGVEVEFSDLC
jgi:hypothetical protein